MRGELCRDSILDDLIVVEPGHGGVGLEATVEFDGEGERLVGGEVDGILRERVCDGWRHWGEGREGSVSGWWREGHKRSHKLL